MPISSRLFTAGSVALLLACAGCLGLPNAEPTQQREISVRSGLKPRVLALETAPLTGNVIAPGVIAAGAGNVIAAGAGNVIAPGGGQVIANGGGQVIAPGAGNLKLLATAESLPVSGAVVILRDAVTRERINWVEPIVTDETGAFSFPKLPTKINFLIEAVFVTPDQKPYRLIGIARPKKGAQGEIKVSWSSTAVASSVLAQAAQSANPAMYLMDAERMAEAQARLADAVAALPEAERLQMVKRTVEAAAGGEGQATIVVEDVLPEAVLGEPAKTAAEMAGKDGELAAAMEAMQVEMARTPTADQQDIVVAASTLTRSEPTIDGSRITIPVTTASASPTSAPTPTPTPTPKPGWEFFRIELRQAFQTAAFMTATTGGVALVDRGVDALVEVTPVVGTAPKTTRFAASHEGLAVLNGEYYTYDSGKNAILNLSTGTNVAVGTLIETPNVLAGTARGLMGLNASGLFLLGTRVPLELLAVKGVLHLAVAPDGSSALVTTREAPNVILVHSLKDGSLLQSIKLPSDVTGLATDGTHYVALAAAENLAYQGTLGIRTGPQSFGKHEMLQSVAIHPRYGVIVAAGGILYVYTPKW